MVRLRDADLREESSSVRIQNVCGRLRSSIVAVVQTSEPRKRKHSTAMRRANSLPWCFLIETQMRSVVVVITNILRQQPLQVGFVECDDVVGETGDRRDVFWYFVE